MLLWQPCLCDALTASMRTARPCSTEAATLRCPEGNATSYCSRTSRGGSFGSSERLGERHTSFDKMRQQLFEYRSVRYWSKEINGTLPGGRKNNFFNSRSGGGRGHRAAAPAESCQSLPKRSPWGRLGSVLYTCKRLRRMRRRFNHFWSISLSRPLGLAIFWPWFASRALREH